MEIDSLFHWQFWSEDQPSKRWRGLLFLSVIIFVSLFNQQKEKNSILYLFSLHSVYSDIGPELSLCHAWRQNCLNCWKIKNYFPGADFLKTFYLVIQYTFLRIDRWQYLDYLWSSFILYPCLWHGLIHSWLPMIPPTDLDAHLLSSHNFLFVLSFASGLNLYLCGLSSELFLLLLWSLKSIFCSHWRLYFHFAILLLKQKPLNSLCNLLSYVQLETMQASRENIRKKEKKLEKMQRHL